jgi:hypothetical protein
MIDLAEFDTFYATKELTDGLTAAIHDYARSSQEESEGRLRAFKTAFPALLVAEV